MPHIKPSIEVLPVLELKEFPSHLKYAFLVENNTLPVIIAAYFSERQANALVTMLKLFKNAIGWTIADIIGIHLRICTHKIKLVKYYKPSIEHQRLLKPHMQKVVNEEIINWLDAGVIYLILDCEWVSLVQCVPNKGGYYSSS